MLHQHIQHHHHHNHHSLSSVPSSPISTTSSDGGVGGNVTTQNDIQYHHHPQHHYHHHVISTSPQDYQEEDIHLQDYQTSTASLMNHHSHSHSDICGINVNSFTGSLGGSNEIPQLVRMEKRKRTNYSMGGNKAKIEEAVKYLLELSERARPNVRNVAEKMGIPYNTLRDHFKKAQGLMAPPRRTVFDYPMAEYKGAETLEELPVEPVEAETPAPATYDVRRRGRKPALPRLIEYQLKVFIKEMCALGLVVDRTQLKQVAYKIATDLHLVEFKATDMWLQAFQARHSLSVAHSGGSKKKGWRLPDVPIYGSSTYSQYKVIQSKPLDLDYPLSVSESGVDYPVVVDQQTYQSKSDDASEKTTLPNSLTEHGTHVELDYLNMLHSLPTPPPHFANRLPVSLNDEELRVRSIASFRSVLGEIQALLLADGGSLLSLINHDSLRSSGNDSQQNRCDLARLIMPQIEKCTVLGIGNSEDGPQEQNYYCETSYNSQSHSPPHDGEPLYQQSEVREANQQTKKRQKVLPLASFQSSHPEQRADSEMHPTPNSSPLVGLHAGRSMLPDDDHTITASALSATQVLYPSSSGHSGAAVHSHHTTTPYYPSAPVFGAVSNSAPVDLRRRRMQLIRNDELTSLAHGNNEPAIITTKIHHPRSVFYTNQLTHDMMMSNYRSSSSSDGIIAMRAPIINPSPASNMNMK